MAGLVSVSLFLFHQVSIHINGAKMTMMKTCLFLHFVVL